MTVAIDRNPEAAAAGSYDLIVIGGGFYGVMLTLEAARRGLATLLVERDDFGGATSWNSLRIVHGGLRYLQSLDLRRYRESMVERRWFLRSFPDLVEPLPCLMPLWSPPRGGRLRRRSAFGLAFAADRLLGRERNAGLSPVSADNELPRDRLLDAAETAALFPGVDRAGLRGGALWHDAVMPDSQRLLVEALRWAGRCGARALNYTEVTGLLTEDDRAAGVRAVDRETGESLELRAPAVVNCAGPWSRALAARCDRDLPELFRPVLAFNLFLDCEPPSEAALAVAAPERGAQTWFLLPWEGGLLAGTAYVPAGPSGLESGGDFSAGPGEEHVEEFLAALRAALPASGIQRDQVRRVFSGWLPAASAGSRVPAGRPVIHDHGNGLLSVSGVKLTTSRAVAEEVLGRIFAQRGESLPAPGWIERPAADAPFPLDDFLRLAGQNPDSARAHLRGLVKRQAVVRLDDLLLRRTDWGLQAGAAEAARVCDTLGWAAGEAPRRAEGGR